MLKLARAGEFGPAFMSPEWRDETLPPGLVSVVMTRIVPGGYYVPHMMLVDRTCLGVKDAFSGERLSSTELAAYIEQMGEIHAGRMEEVNVSLAQSVVYHAIDYAKSLGFAPHRDLDPAMVGPRPSTLEATPLARPERPFYMPGPNDDVVRIATKLKVAVGLNGFDLPELPEGDDDFFDDDLDDELADEPSTNP
ncbi:MAG TPA: hypothetical protein VM925_02090 [Labilithrix sp.]|nr:hypothetical protein [Labilithrix sp.]